MRLGEVMLRESDFLSLDLQLSYIGMHINEKLNIKMPVANTGKKAEKQPGLPQKKSCELHIGIKGTVLILLSDPGQTSS